MKISKINQLVLKGLLAEDPELFINRLGILLDRNNSEILPQLAEGVIIGVSIKDNDAALAWLQSRSRDRTIVEITGVECTSNKDGVRISYRYTGKTKFFTTQNDAERYAQGYCVDGVSVKDDAHPYEGIYYSTSSECCSAADKDWLNIEVL